MYNQFCSKGIIVTLLYLMMGTAIAQINQPVQVADSLSFMLGTWKGEGYMRMGPKKQEFNLTEVISSKVNGAVISIDGAGVSTDSITNETRNVHDAFGVVYYDMEIKGFRMMAFSSAAAQKDVELKVENRVLTWSFTSDNGGFVKFTEDFSDEGKWTTVGEYSPDGSRWFTFMEYFLENTLK